MAFFGIMEPNACVRRYSHSGQNFTPSRFAINALQRSHRTIEPDTVSTDSLIPKTPLKAGA